MPPFLRSAYAGPLVLRSQRTTYGQYVSSVRGEWWQEPINS